ncbi:hypothetical protein MNQ98_18825 [Paenibacillus sp. N3/727]|uniref:hypothetical protein n=1 Tax=Paenibacillus sp. N3/727 TaxID=2925845 RepID=UPI001F53D1A2|nr:hypothetical protein [Paenibacillus sp. N3/727]UNK16546.1 hypothetical protein MNQ98_18825 [Paenibacillus sp. N3/727]
MFIDSRISGVDEAIPEKRERSAKSFPKENYFGSKRFVSGDNSDWRDGSYTQRLTTKKFLYTEVFVHTEALFHDTMDRK